MKKLTLSLLALFAFSAQAADYPYTSFGTVHSFGVNGPFADAVHFTVVVPGTYTFSVRSILAHAGCNRFQSCGNYYGKLTHAQLQTSLGTALLDLQNVVPNGVAIFTGSLNLHAGNYAIKIAGAGAGTMKHLGQGSYSVNVTAPAAATPPPPVKSCDYLRDILQTQGYSDQAIEQIITGYKAQVPPLCAGD